MSLIPLRNLDEDQRISVSNASTPQLRVQQPRNQSQINIPQRSQNNLQVDPSTAPQQQRRASTSLQDSGDDRSWIRQMGSAFAGGAVDTASAAIRYAPYISPTTLAHRMTPGDGGLGDPIEAGADLADSIQDWRQDFFQEPDSTSAQVVGEMGTLLLPGGAVARGVRHTPRVANWIGNRGRTTVPTLTSRVTGSGQQRNAFIPRNASDWRAAGGYGASEVVGGGGTASLQHHGMMHERGEDPSLAESFGWGLAADAAFGAAGRGIRTLRSARRTPTVGQQAQQEQAARQAAQGLDTPPGGAIDGPSGGTGAGPTDLSPRPAEAVGGNLDGLTGSPVSQTVAQAGTRSADIDSRIAEITGQPRQEEPTPRPPETPEPTAPPTPPRGVEGTPDSPGGMTSIGENLQARFGDQVPDTPTSTGASTTGRVSRLEDGSIVDEQGNTLAPPRSQQEGPDPVRDGDVQTLSEIHPGFTSTVLSREARKHGAANVDRAAQAVEGRGMSGLHSPDAALTAELNRRHPGRASQPGQRSRISQMTDEEIDAEAMREGFGPTPDETAARMSSEHPSTNPDIVINNGRYVDRNTGEIMDDADIPASHPSSVQSQQPRSSTGDPEIDNMITGRKRAC